MKRLLKLSLFFSLFLLIFFILAPKLSTPVQAQTCSPACSSTQICAYSPSTGFATCLTSCSSISGQYCNFTCGGTGTGTGYCSGGNQCCKSAPATCKNNGDVCSANGDCCSNYCTTTGQYKTCQPAAQTYTCTTVKVGTATASCVTNSASGVQGCSSNNGHTDTSYTCATGQVCCVPNASAGSQTCAAAGGTCMPVCSSPISGTTGCTSPSVCCGSGTTCTTADCASENGGLGCQSGYTCNGTKPNCTCNSGSSTSTYQYKDCLISGCDNDVSDYNLQCNGTSCDTGIGPINTTDFAGFARSIFSALLSVAGLIAAVLIIISGYKLVMSRGNPEKVNDAREQLTAAIVGLLFIIFSLVFLEFIGLDVLGLPNFLG